MQQSIIAVWLGCGMHIHWCMFVPVDASTLANVTHCLNIDRPIICMRWARMCICSSSDFRLNPVHSANSHTIYTDNSLDPFQSSSPSLPLSSRPNEWNTPRSLCSLAGAKNRLPLVFTIYCAYVCRSNWICKQKKSIYCMLCVRLRVRMHMHCMHLW